MRRKGVLDYQRRSRSAPFRRRKVRPLTGCEVKLGGAFGSWTSGGRLLDMDPWGGKADSSAQVNRGGVQWQVGGGGPETELGAPEPQAKQQ